MEVVTTLPRGRHLTRAELDALPDDGWRHELVDGALVMTPAPSPRHQLAVFGLASVLGAACPPDLRVLFAPLDVVLAVDTVLQPDVLVARRSDFSERDLPTAPLLAVEVLSPSTRHIDLGLKRSRYEAAGCAAYWAVDPGNPTTAPTLTAWELRDGAFVEVAHAAGEEPAVLAVPFAVTVVPAALVR
jgi:Uma2 family endonuclease